MSIERDRYDFPITFVCDECGAREDTGHAEFLPALAAFRRAGGKAQKDVDGDWMHLCKVCA